MLFGLNIDLYFIVYIKSIVLIKIAKDSSDLFLLDHSEKVESD